MKKRTAVELAPEHQKVQFVLCSCCEARLALHFVHGESEVSDVELMAMLDASSHVTVAKQSRAEIAIGNEYTEDAAMAPHQTQRDELHDNAAVEAAIERLGASSSCVSNIKTHAIATNVCNPPATRDQVKDLHQPSPRSSKLFPLFYRQRKTVHLVRHGHTASSFVGLEDASHRFDLRLTPLGHQQARSIAFKLMLLKPDVIFVSPLTRALQTLCGAFPSAQVQEPGQPRVEVTPLHAEHVMCSGDVGRPPQILGEEYPWLCFDALPMVWWYSQPKFPNDAMRMEFNSVEPREELRKRVGGFRQFLRSRPENVFVVIGHSTFFKELTNTRQRMMNCEIRTLVL